MQLGRNHEGDPSARGGDLSLSAGENVDLLALRQAIVVAEQGSFRKASARLGVQPSSVSRRIRILEDLIGVSVFQRERRGVRPTAAGRKLLLQARVLFSDLDTLVRTARLNGSGSEGSLRIGLATSIAGGVARRTISAFVVEHPFVELRFVDGTPSDHVIAVAALRLDAAFVLGATGTPDCEEEKLWSERVMVAISSQHQLLSI